MHRETDPKRLFERWFAQPLKALRSIPNGDGGFVALATSCFLYERYAVAVIKERGESATKEGTLEQLARDFCVDKDTARAFWDVIRNGILHLGMPKQRSRDGRLPGWFFSASLTRPIELDKTRRPALLKVEPWLVTDTVITLWESRPDLLARSSSFPWGAIGFVRI